MNHKNIQHLTQWALLGVGAILLIGAFSFLGTSSASSNLLSAQEFMAKYGATTNAVLVDVRTPAEFNAGHISGAENIDQENPNFSVDIKALDTSKTYFIYCHSGRRSALARTLMESDGIKNVYELSGGISNAPELLK